MARRGPKQARCSDRRAEPAPAMLSNRPPPRADGTPYPEAARTQVTTCISGNRPLTSAATDSSRGRGDVLATHRPATCAARFAAPRLPHLTWWAPREHRQLLNTATPCALPAGRAHRSNALATPRPLSRTRFLSPAIPSPEHIHLRTGCVCEITGASNRPLARQFCCSPVPSPAEGTRISAHGDISRLVDLPLRA